MQEYKLLTQEIGNVISSGQMVKIEDLKSWYLRASLLEALLKKIWIELKEYKNNSSTRSNPPSEEMTP